ncbi:MAG: 2-amino-4-oxopentanoate thiolase subunit OrtA [Firmicutes bacterium]|jgi:hypothetical protein|nr:2-amino-4-oxopentanoate thiolase subunit OrtA [Bacillota bacterium]
MGTARKGDWVQVHSVVLRPGERAPQVPPDTAAVPLEMRVKGFLLRDAAVGDEVEVRTMTGRIVAGRLVSVNPPYRHDFGEPIPELLAVGRELREILGGGESD